MSKKSKIILTATFSFLLMFNFTLVAQATPPRDLSCGTQGRTIKAGGWLEDIGIQNGLLVPVECLCSGNSSTPLPPGSVGPPAPAGRSSCDLNSMLQALINVTTLIVGTTGSVALLMFGYGGVMFIIAAGNQERVTKAKQILGAAAIGIVIIFTAWVVTNFVILALTKGEVGSKATIFGQDWFKPQTIDSSATPAPAVRSAEVTTLPPATGQTLNPPEGSSQDELDQQASGGLTVAGLTNPTLRQVVGGNGVEPLASAVKDNQGRTFVGGVVSTFGGPGDTTVGDDETGAITGERLRDLDTDTDLYVAFRWDYSQTPASTLRNSQVQVYNPANGQYVNARIVDWGPHTSTGASVDASQAVLTALGAEANESQLFIRIVNN